MFNTWLISDTHFFHDQPFVWQARGFNSVQEMNEVIVERWNETIKPNDVVYHLGDVTLGKDYNAAAALLKKLNGQIYIVYGNHDTENRMILYRALPNVRDIQFGYRIKTGKKSLLLTHYQTLTGNYDNSKTYNIHGHTHSTSPYCEYELMYNVCCDAHNCYPVALEDVIKGIKDRNK